MEWNVVNTAEDVERLNYLFGSFHDSVLKEICFSSGNYVDKNLSMFLHESPVARFLLQREWSDPAVIEIEFRDVLRINIKPMDEGYDPVILYTRLHLEDDTFFWSAKDYLLGDDDKDNCTWITAKQVYWRERDDLLGSDGVYMRE